MSQRAEWRRYVVQRRRGLRDTYPCAAPTRRPCRPRHGTRIGPVTEICKPCRDELYQQLAAEYVAAQERQRGEAA